MDHRTGQDDVENRKFLNSNSDLLFIEPTDRAIPAPHFFHVFSNSSVTATTSFATI
jgi:hypothetical protein